MNKDQMVREIAAKTNLSLKDAKSALEAFTTVVSETIKTEKITLVGHGTYECVDRAERVGRNPRNGEVITIPATKAVKFKAGKDLKESTNA